MTDKYIRNPLAWDVLAAGAKWKGVKRSIADQKLTKERLGKAKRVCQISRRRLLRGIEIWQSRADGISGVGFRRSLRRVHGVASCSRHYLVVSETGDAHNGQSH